MISFSNHLLSFFDWFTADEPETPAVSLASRAETEIDRAVFALRTRRAILEGEIFRRTQELNELQTAIEAYEAAQRVFIDAQVPALQSTIDQFLEDEFLALADGGETAGPAIHDPDYSFGTGETAVSENGTGLSGFHHPGAHISHPEEARGEVDSKLSAAT